MSPAGRLLFAAIALLWLAAGVVVVASLGDQRCTARWDRCQ